MRTEEEGNFEGREEVQSRKKWEREKEKQGLGQWKIITIDVLF